MSRAEVIEIATCLAEGRFGRYTEEVRRVTEGRAEQGQAYSWCGDLVTYCLQYGRILDGQMLNRVSLNGVWKPGQNINMVVERARALGALYTGPAALEFFREGVAPGDPVIIERPSGNHICLFKSRESDSSYYTWDGNGIGGTTRETNRSLGPGVYPSPILAIVSLRLWFPTESEATDVQPSYDGIYMADEGQSAGEPYV